MTIQLRVQPRARRTALERTAEGALKTTLGALEATEGALEATRATLSDTRSALAVCERELRELRAEKEAPPSVTTECNHRV